MEMICNITDKNSRNIWDNDFDCIDAPSFIRELTLYDLMAEDVNVWASKNKDYGYILEVDMEDGKSMREQCINPCAMESLAYFCKRFLSFYEKIQEE